MGIIQSISNQLDLGKIDTKSLSVSNSVLDGISGVNNQASKINEATNIEEFDFGTIADGFSYSNSKSFLPTSEEEINANASKMKSDIDKLESEIKQTEQDIQNMESDLEGFSSSEEMRSKYALDIEESSFKTSTPEEHMQKVTMTDMNYQNPDGSINQELYDKEKKDYTKRYDAAFNEYTGGQYGSQSDLNNSLSEKSMDLNNLKEDLRLKQKEQEESKYDAICLKDSFKNNYDRKTDYKNKISGQTSHDNLLFAVTYLNMSDWHDAENYIKQTYGKDISAFDMLECLAEEKYGITPEKLRTLDKNEAEDFITKIQESGQYWASDAYNIYKYMNDKQLAMYKTLVDDEGLDVARNYYASIEEKITAIQGMEDAINFFTDLLKGSGYELEDVQIQVNAEDGSFKVYTKEKNGKYVENYKLTTNLGNLLNSFGQGLGDGFTGFFEGLGHILERSDNKSRSDYKKLYIANFLSKNVVLKGSYDVGSGIGNLLPSMTVSAITGYLGVPAVFQEKAGYILLGLSAYGNSISGYNKEGINGIKAELMAALNGALEYLTGKMFGRIPWLNEEANVSLMDYIKEGKGFLSSFNWLDVGGQMLDNMAHEGIEEFVQAYFENGFDAFARGEKYNISDTTSEALYSFLMGALTGGILSGTNVGVEFTFAGVNYKVHLDSLIEDIKNQGRESGFLFTDKQAKEIAKTGTLNPSENVSTIGDTYLKEWKQQLSKLGLDFSESVMSKMAELYTLASSSKEQSKAGINYDNHYLLKHDYCFHWSQLQNGLFVENHLTYDQGKILEKLFFDNPNNVIAVHVTGQGQDVNNKIVSEGLHLSGSSLQGVVNSNPQLYHNCRLYSAEAISEDISNDYLGYLTNVVGASYPGTGSQQVTGQLPSGAIIMSIPSEIANDPSQYTYKDNQGRTLVKPEYIVADIMTNPDGITNINLHNNDTNSVKIEQPNNDIFSDSIKNSNTSEINNNLENLTGKKIDLNDFNLSEGTKQYIKFFQQFPEGRNGAFQGIIQACLLHPEVAASRIEAFQKIIESYFPNLTDTDKMKLLSHMNSSESGGGGICNYAATMNIIMKYFEDKPEDFNQTFGYDMTRMNASGFILPNDDLMLVDFYCFMNQNNSIVNEAGQWVFKGGYKSDLGIANNGSDSYDAITNWLKSKGYDCTATRKTVYNNSTVLPWQRGLDIPSEKVKPYIVDSIENALAEGKSLYLDIHPNLPNAFGNKGHDGKIPFYRMNGEVEINNAGHTVSILGVLDNNDLLVQSQGKISNVSLDDLLSITCSISQVSINRSR